MHCPMKFNARTTELSTKLDKGYQGVEFVEQCQCNGACCAWWLKSPKIPGEGSCAINVLGWELLLLERHITKREEQ